MNTSKGRVRGTRKMWVPVGWKGKCSVGHVKAGQGGMHKKCMSWESWQHGCVERTELGTEEVINGSNEGNYKGNAETGGQSKGGKAGRWDNREEGIRAGGGSRSH